MRIFNYSKISENKWDSELLLVCCLLPQEAI